ncbi:MAG TPA: FkbM family methyltransferase [Alphaproteobacteria bacterium]
MSATVHPTTMSYKEMAGQWVPRWLYELTLGLFRNTHRTYSQYGQDAVLLSYLRRRHWEAGIPTGLGRYLEIGSFLPVTHSNTYGLYRRGWSGVTVEAMPHTAAAFKLLRPRDRHLALAVAPTAGTLTFYHWGDVNGFNTASEAQAEIGARQLGREPEKITVRAQTLSQIIDDNCDLLPEIDLLSMSVGGVDFAVLSSNDWDRHRPKIITTQVFEAHCDRAVSSPTYRLLTDKGYRLYAWTPPCLIFLRGDQFPFRGS